MRKSYLAIAILLAGITLMTSCKKNTSTTTGNVIPSGCVNTTNWLADGHKLVYATYSPYISADSLYVTFHLVSPGVFSSTSIYDDGSLYPAATSYLKPCSTIIYQSTSSSMSNAEIGYKTDGTIGDKWTAILISLGGTTGYDTTTIAAKNVSVTVPAGTFNCIQLHSVVTIHTPYYQTVVTDYYLDPTYGPVEATGTTVDYELARANF
jgi:hypothetical protein